MANTRRFRLPSALLVVILTAAAQATAGAQAPCPSSPAQPQAGSRLAGDWHSSAAEPLAAGKLPALSAGLDLGIAPGNIHLDRMLLLLKPSPAQQDALDAFLQSQQTRGDCAYRQWLTPAQFADRFANSASDVSAIAAWLAQQGFSVAPLPAGRGWIEFSGTAAQVEQAFGAAVHGYSTASGPRYALTSGISVPAVVVPLVRGLVSLDGALSAPALTTPQAVATAPSALAGISSPGQAEALTPQLLAPMLHLDALHASGATGAGETIAIASRSNVQTADIAAFRSTFGLPASPVSVSMAGPDPGLTTDQAEAEMAASWAGAAAPGAHIVVVPSASTAATDGIDLSLAAIVDRNLAHTVVVDFSSCEAALSDAHQAFYAAVYRQASAEGIAAIAATGDSGAAACHAPGSTAPVSSGLAVNAIASTPWNTAVGAAAFAAADGSSLAAWSPASSADPAYAGGGGRSSVYAIPSWQAYLQPAGSGRLLPDIALPTGIDSALSRGLAFCFSGSAAPSGCTLVRSGGTSAAAAIFGGIAALIAQQQGPQGNLAPALYALSAQSGVFNDVQQGDASLPCAAGTPECDASGKIGYAAAKGFDLATGLGSPNAQSLLNALGNPNGTGADNVAIAVAPVQNSYNPKASITFTATVTSGTGGATPTGSVNFTNQTSGQNLNSAPYTLDANGQASITVVGALSTGSNNVIAAYGGSTTYAAKSSAPATVTIAPSSTTTTVTPATYSPIPGTAFNVTVTVTVGTPPAGTVNPGGNITLTLDGGSPQTAAITANAGVFSATFSETVTTSGAHNLQAVFAGGANYQTSTSQVVTVNGADNTPTVTLTAAPVQSSYNPSATLTFTAAVASQDGGPTPTGTVTFVDQTTGQNLGAPATLSGGTASVVVNGGLPVNGNSIVANYNGDGSYAKASSQVLSVNIQKSSTTATVTPATTTPTPGTAFNVTVTIAVGTPPAGPANPTGQIQLTLDGNNYAAAPASTAGGVTSATFSVTVPTTGPHNLQAIYAGDNNYQNSTSQSVTVNSANQTAGVTLSVAPVQPSATYNPSATLTFTAVVASQTNGPTPTGTVNFFDQATGLNLNAGPVTLTAGSASVVVNGGLPVNGNSIIANYSGDGTYAKTSSQALTVNIQPSSTTTTVVPSTTTPGVGVAFQVTTSVTVGTPPLGNLSPTGKMTLTLDAISSQTATINGNGGVGTGTATFNVTVNSSGPHNLQAVYAGDTNYASSTSQPVSVNAAKGATVTTLTASPATPVPGTPESFTATITAATPVAGVTNSFTGTVTFFDGTTQIGTANVSANAATLGNITLTGSAQHSITAVYSGDGNWAGSTSAAINLASALYPVTVTLTATPQLAGPGQVITLTATVTPAVAPATTVEQNPTGNVAFYNGTTLLGTAALSPAQGNSSTAQLLFSALPAGTGSITAVYVGDLVYATGTSNAITVTIQDFTITPGPNNPPADLDIVKGTSGQASFIIGGVGGFNSQVSVVCVVPAQDDMTCTASPQSVTPTQTVTFVIQTFATGGPTAALRNPPSLWKPAVGGAAFAALFVFLLPFGKRARLLSGRGRRMLILLLLLVGLSAAGMGCSSISGVNQATGTPLGETTLTITAAVNIDNTVVSHSAYLTVNVLPQGSTGTLVPASGDR